MGIDAERFRIIGIYFDGLETQFLRGRQCSGDILRPALTHARQVPTSGPGQGHRVLRIHLHGPMNQDAGAFELRALHAAEKQGNR